MLLFVKAYHIKIFWGARQFLWCAISDKGIVDQLDCEGQQNRQATLEEIGVISLISQGLQTEYINVPRLGNSSVFWAWSPVQKNVGCIMDLDSKLIHMGQLVSDRCVESCDTANVFSMLSKYLHSGFCCLILGTLESPFKAAIETLSRQAVNEESIITETSNVIQTVPICVFAIDGRNGKKRRII